jgi:hypothetical protein
LLPTFEDSCLCKYNETSEDRACGNHLPVIYRVRRVKALLNRQTLTLLEELIGADEQPPKGNLTRIGEQVKHAVNGRNALRAELRAKLQAKIEEVQGDE